MKNKLMLSSLLALAILLTACGPQATPTTAPAPAATAVPAGSSSSSYNNPSGYDVYPTTEPASSSASSAPASAASAPSAAATVAVGPGGFLVDTNGLTLYLFTKDTAGTSVCNGGCASAWPPLTVTGQPVAGAGVDASLLGTTTRSDGSIQVTYNGHPLYYYKSDHAAGDENGQSSGGVWFVVTATGDAMQ